MTPEIKPCPCCGRALVEVEGFSTRSQKQFFHERDDENPCALSMIQLVVSDRPHHIQRLESWNRRVAHPSFQDRLATAHDLLFKDDPTDVPERRARYFEESNETCQAFGMTREEAHALVDYTYDRPPGHPEAEIGASVVTLASLCITSGYDLMACAEADLAKLQRPESIARIRAKRTTRHGRGPLPGLDPA